MVSDTPLAMPPNATDCHVHLFDPERFPYSSERRYTPPPATLTHLRSMHDAIGIERVVLVQPSVYGTENDCLIDGLKQLGNCARGVAVIKPQTSRAELEYLYSKGVRGVRINLQVSKDADVSSASRALQNLALTVQDVPMLIQVYAAMPVLLACASLLRAMPQNVLIDHFGLVRAANGPAQHGFAELLDLMASDNIWMKLSGPYQISDQAPNYFDVQDVASRFFQTSPHRVVWGSDWPHTGGSDRPANNPAEEVEPFRPENDRYNLSIVTEGLDLKARHALLVDNPARLFQW